MEDAARKMELWAVIALLACVLQVSLSADIIDPEDCTSFPCLIFNDNFDYLDSNVWEHEINMVGGGNGEFQMYVNNRSISYTKNGLLHIKPDLTSHWKGEDFLSSGDLDLWGMNGVNSECTSNILDGCRRQATPKQIIKPVQSARLRTLNKFAFTYGRMDVRAKLPNGDWMWPAVWLLPSRFPYGRWPASGEIDLIEGRGNADYGAFSNRHASSMLQASPYEGLANGRHQGRYNAPENSSLTDDFNIWTLEWNDQYISVSVNGLVIMEVDPITDFYDRGNFTAVHADNPWQGAGKMAPFDQDFYLVLNVAVGGLIFFPDNIPSATPKPWNNQSPTPDYDFWQGVEQWYGTWTQGGVTGRTSDNAALQIDYIRIYKTSNSKM